VHCGEGERAKLLRARLLFRLGALRAPERARRALQLRRVVEEAVELDSSAIDRADSGGAFGGECNADADARVAREAGLAVSSR
jgi:hypothetical protein